MAGAPGGGEPGPAAGEPLLQRPDSGQSSPEPPAHGKPQQGFLSSLFTRNQSCPLMLLKTLETSRSRDLLGSGVAPHPGARKGQDLTDPGLHCSPRAARAGGGVGPLGLGVCGSGSPSVVSYVSYAAAQAVGYR